MPMGWATKGKGTVLGAGSVGPLTYICLVLLPSCSCWGGEDVGCSRQSDSSLCAAVNSSCCTNPSLNPPS